MTYIVDIDDTLLLYPHNKTFINIKLKYNQAKANTEEIDLVNKAYEKGDIIILHTGRNWEKYEYTKNQMKEFGIKYHELVMGKPQGIYIDATQCAKSLKDVL